MEELKKKIVQDMNESKLPLDCIYYLLKDLFRDLEAQYYMTMQQQQNSQNGGNDEEQKTEENKSDNVVPFKKEAPEPIDK